MSKIKLLVGILTFFSFSSFSQSASDCPDGDNGCASVTNGFPISPSGFGAVDELAGNNISNPSTNPNTVPGNSGCLLSGELNSTWVTIYVQQSGTLEFTLGANGGTGFLDWAMWDNSNGNACTDIANNTLPPVACNWNSSGAGFTGMADPANLPTGANPGNFEAPLTVTAGQSFTLMFSNFSGLTATSIPLTPIGSAVLGCDPSTPKRFTKCIDVPEIIDYTIQLPANVTSGVAIPAANVIVTPPTVTFSTNVAQDYEIVWTSPDSTWSDSAYVSVQQPLSPTFAGLSDSVCDGEFVSLSATPANTNTYFSWSIAYPGVTTFASYFPANNTVNTNMASNNPGSVWAIFTETDTLNICPSVSDTALMVFSNEFHTTSQADPTCNGFSDGNITVTSFGTLGAVEYSIDNGVTWSNSSAYTGLPAGIYEVISRDIIGCTFATTVTLTDPDVITISTVGDTTVCENGIATLIATSTNGSAFNWSHTNSVVSNQTLFPSTDSTITVHATNIVGCSSDTITINLSMYDPITISITGNDSICPGDPTSVEVFPNGGLDGYDYTWTANGSGANYVTSQFSANPTAQVQYCATVVDGCESTPKSLCTNIIMRDVPTTTFTSKVIEKCDPAEIEIEVTTPDYLFATAVVGTENTNYSVVNASPDPSTVTHTYSSAGDFDVYLKVISQYGCESDTFAFNEFTAFPVPEPNFIINPEEASIFLPFFDLTNTTRTPDLSYIWQMPGGEPQVSTQENTSVSYPEGEPGVYPIQLIAISDQGCRDTITRTAVVLNDIVVYSPNSFTPDGDDHNEFWRVYIKGINIYDYHLQIYNRWGEVVFESFDPEATWDGTFANGDHLEPGTFVWFIQTKDAVTDKVHEFRGTVNLFR